MTPTLTPCTCDRPLLGPATLTDYTGPPTVYVLCETCGMPMLDAGVPESEWLRWAE